jgi:hypothetical protein
MRPKTIMLVIKYLVSSAVIVRDPHSGTNVNLIPIGYPS